MRSRPKTREGGQALIMVTIALVAMSGLIGMAVDFGWSYFMRRQAQAAADSAALAGARAAMTTIQTTGASALSCTNLSCGSQTSCGAGATGAWQSACDYAQQNGFTQGGDSGRQQVSVASGVNSPAAPPPTASNVNVRYWLTVRVSTTIPQLYSAVLGNANATIAARATAAITDYLVNGSIIALNREGDPAPSTGGTNGYGIWQQLNSYGTHPVLLAGSNSTIWTPNNGGMALASNDSGAGTNLGPFTFFLSPYLDTRGNLAGYGGWTATHSYTTQGDGSQFVDPYAGMGQPPMPTTAFAQNQFYGVPGGDLTSFCGMNCAPGVYYATTNGAPSGAPLTNTGSVTFANTTGSGPWGDYVFYGGLNVAGSAVNFGPGRYVLAGVANSSTPVLSFGSGSQISGGSGTDAGRIFIATDANYPGLSTIAPLPSPLTSSSFSYGQINIDAGSTGSVKLYGLGTAATPQNLPTDQNPHGYTLNDFGPAAIWQDQGFSDLTYTTNTTPQMVVGSNMQVDGILYQPRGAWLRVKPNAFLSGIGAPLTAAGGARLITGAVDIGSSGRLVLCTSGCSQGAPLWNHMVALVE